jgi:CO/xanthine dehydrogenase FAD-binding subunit
MVAAADLERFGQMVSAASRPITDHRSTAEYRRHAVGVLAKRLVRRAADVEVAA